MIRSTGYPRRSGTSGTKKKTNRGTVVCFHFNPVMLACVLSYRFQRHGESPCQHDQHEHGRPGCGVHDLGPSVPQCLEREWGEHRDGHDDGLRYAHPYIRLEG